MRRAALVELYCSRTNASVSAGERSRNAAQLLVAGEPIRVARQLSEHIGPALYHFPRQPRRACERCPRDEPFHRRPARARAVGTRQLAQVLPRRCHERAQHSGPQIGKEGAEIAATNCTWRRARRRELAEPLYGTPTQHLRQPRSEKRYCVRNSAACPDRPWRN